MTTLNKFCVGSHAAQIAIANLPIAARWRADQIEIAPPLPEWPGVALLTSDEALNLAAWLVAVTGRRREFLELLEAIEKT